ncbi:MAG: hypothetical protein AB8B73_13910 [Ekhidna sp.]
MKKFPIIICFLLLSIQSFTQSTDFPLHHPVYQKMEMEDVNKNQGFNTTIKPYSRISTQDFMGSHASSYLRKEMRTYSNDSTLSKHPIFKKIYQYPTDLYYYHDKKLDLHVNPALQFSVGKANDGTGTLFVNSRGLEIRGRIDKKIAFYTYLTENQAQYAQFINDVRDSTLAVPFEGFWKQYNNTGVDFLRAQGYIDVGLSESISAQLGYGKHFVGNGVRSLILSDYANNYPYLRINTETSVFDYTNIFAELIADVDGGAFGILGTGGFSKKYMAMHHLNIKVKPNLHIGLFESVMYGDSTGGLKIEYMNPIIFYRAVEQQNGSEDNAIVGMDFKWNIKNRISLYGQLVIDELLFSEAFAGTGSWRNKQGIQLGAKYMNAFGLEDLILQGEVNKARPYTYAHEDGFTNYSHYNLALAHPLGANFTEYLGKVNYQVNDKFSFEAVTLLASYGNDIGNINYGRDILKDYTVRALDENGAVKEFGNDHLQGNKTNLSILFIRGTYMWKHNLFFDLDATLRNEKDSNGQIDTSSLILGFSCRWNIPQRRFLF